MKIVSEGQGDAMLYHQLNNKSMTAKAVFPFHNFLYSLFKTMFPILSRDDQKHQTLWLPGDFTSGPLTQSGGYLVCSVVYFP